MKKIFLFFFYIILCISENTFAQKPDGPPPPPPPPMRTDTLVKKPNPDTSCYEIEKKDTTWNPGCKSLEQAAEFPGGDGVLFKFLAKNVFYPQLAKELGLQGKVFVTFVIGKQGEVTDVELYRSLSVPSSMKGQELTEEQRILYKKAAKEMEDESIRVVKMMPKWTPANQDGKPVRMRFILPLNYKLS